MATLKTFEGIEHFLSVNQAEIKDNYLVFRQLLYCLGIINQGSVGGYELFNLNQNYLTEIICLKTKRHLILISTKQKISFEVYELLKSMIQPVVTEAIEILGERNLVLKIIKDCNLQFKIIKDRLFWECKKTKDILACSGSLHIPVADDIGEITRMEVNFHKEEFGDESNCDFEETKVLVEKRIENQSILLWKNNNEIVSLINAKIEGDFFYIYHIYTKPTERRKGFGTNLLHNVTSKVIDTEKIRAGVVSQRLNIFTNKIFNVIGFLPVYEMIDTETFRIDTIKNVKNKTTI
jgi:predicted GNAT family acetyltransferase